MTAAARRTPGRILRTLVAHSLRTAENYLTVWGAQRPAGARTPEDVALHA